MDLTPFKLDIDELLGDCVEGNCMTLADMKNKWKERKFSYIFEAKPTRNSAFFMQSLYSYSLSMILTEFHWLRKQIDHCCSQLYKFSLHCAVMLHLFPQGHMISAGPLPKRLGALYILYCLHELQPYRPSFKIYLSLGELRKLRSLVREAKAFKIGLVPVLVKRMLERNMFLFGFVDMLGGTAGPTDDDITRQPNWRIEKVYEKLFKDSNLENCLHMNLDTEMEVENLKKHLSDYELAKELAIQEASQTTDIKDMEHIREKKTAGDVMESIVHKWNAQKDDFYEKTEIIQPDQIMVTEDIFDKELENIWGE